MLNPLSPLSSQKLLKTYKIYVVLFVFCVFLVYWHQFECQTVTDVFRFISSLGHYGAFLMEEIELIEKISKLIH